MMNILDTFSFEQKRLLYRRGTSDRQAIAEVIERRAYERKDFPIEATDVWLDLGANCGSFAVLVATLGAKVIAYEPDPTSAQLTRDNLQRNKLPGVVFERAIAKQSGTATFYHDAERPWRSNLFRPRRNARAITVQSVTLADALTDEVTAVKMDIEGAEIDILQTRQNWRNVRKLCFEWHFDHQPFCSYFRQALSLLGRDFELIAGANLAEDLVVYKFFPPARVVFCRRKEGEAHAA